MNVLNGSQDIGQEDTISIDTLTLENSLKEEREKEIWKLNSLGKKVSHLHTDLLYYRNPRSKIGSDCYEAWRIMIRRLEGTPYGWRELGYALGVGQDYLGYISEKSQGDLTDMVLKVYKQNEKATIDNIVNALIKMKRYDILKALEEPFLKIAQHFNKEDTGYQSNERSTGQREIVTLKNLANDLPPALTNHLTITTNGNDEPAQPTPLTMLPIPDESTLKDKPMLFLTFARDGFPTALNIQEYVSNWIDVLDVRVITLSGRREEIYQNPEKFIREYFEKADFIVPIITPGYLDEIASHNINIPNTAENLDHRYVSFIYNLIVSNYIHATGCLNKKVRSVLPQNAVAEVFRRIVMYPDLMPWTYEKNFDEQFQAFLKK